MLAISTAVVLAGSLDVGCASILGYDVFDANTGYPGMVAVGGFDLEQALSSALESAQSDSVC